tara:strand:- start:26852 stop:27070 length:219 start_codon:yes stop_codon:yes gene_type:complete
MSKMSKKKSVKTEDAETTKAEPTVEDYIAEINKAQNIINQLVADLNNHKALCVQYENTINALTGRLLEGRSQ